MNLEFKYELVPPNETVSISCRPDRIFTPTDLTVQTFGGFIIAGCTVEDVEQMGGPVPALIFADGARGKGVAFNTCAARGEIVLRVKNTTDKPANFAAVMESSREYA